MGYAYSNKNNERERAGSPQPQELPPPFPLPGACNSRHFVYTEKAPHAAASPKPKPDPRRFARRRGERKLDRKGMGSVKNRKGKKKRGFRIGMYLAGSIAVVTGLAIVMPKLLDYIAAQMDKPAKEKNEHE